MSCDQQQHLTAYLDGELLDAERGQFEAHLSTCADCSATRIQLERALEQLSRLTTPAPGPAMRQQVLAGLAPASPAPPVKRRMTLRRRARVLIAAAALLAVAIPGAQLIRRSAEGAEDLLYAQHGEVLEDYEVIGLEGPEDVELIAHLQEFSPAEVK